MGSQSVALRESKRQALDTGGQHRGSQPFWHSGPVLLKTSFPHTGREGIDREEDEALLA